MSKNKHCGISGKPEIAATNKHGKDNKFALQRLKIPTSKSNYKKPESIKEFERLYYDYEWAKRSNIPEYARYKTTFNDKTANGLTKCCISWLRLNGHQAERINTMGRPIDKTRTVTDVTGARRRIGSCKWIPSGSQKGSADISATIMGQSIKIEIKVGRDRQSEAQKQYQRQVEAAGGVYLIIGTFAEFMNWYDSFVIEKGGKNVR